MAAPFFLAALNLEGRACVVFGGEQETLSRARALREHGARVTVVGPEPSETLRAWILENDDVTLEEREPRLTDLDDAWLAVQADRNPNWAEWLGLEAARKHIFFCAIDQPEHNGFAHVGVARAGALQIGVSTSGVVPGVAGALRKLLQTLLDESNFEQAVRRMADLREATPAPERGARLRALSAKIRLEGRIIWESFADD